MWKQLPPGIPGAGPVLELPCTIVQRANIDQDAIPTRPRWRPSCHLLERVRRAGDRSPVLRRLLARCNQVSNQGDESGSFGNNQANSGSHEWHISKVKDRIMSRL